MGSCVFIGLIFSQQLLDELHGEIFWVFEGRSREKHSHIHIGHFIISHKHSRGSEIRFFRIFGLNLFQKKIVFLNNFP